MPRIAFSILAVLSIASCGALHASDDPLAAFRSLVCIETWTETWLGADGEPQSFK